MLPRRPSSLQHGDDFSTVGEYKAFHQERPGHAGFKRQQFIPSGIVFSMAAATPRQRRRCGAGDDTALRG